MLVIPLSDSFKQKSSRKDLGTPRSLQIFFFSISHGSTQSAPCQNNSSFTLNITVVLSSFFVNISVIYSTGN